MRVIARLIGWTLVLLVLLGAGLMVSSELREVVVLTSADDTGSAVETRLWIVDSAGHAWLRAGGPDRDWYRRVQDHPNVSVMRNGVDRPHRAVVVNVPEVRSHIDQLMRKKYGVTDALIHILEGSPQTVAIRLDPL